MSKKKKRQQQSQPSKLPPARPPEPPQRDVDPQLKFAWWQLWITAALGVASVAAQVLQALTGHG